MHDGGFPHYPEAQILSGINSPNSLSTDPPIYSIYFYKDTPLVCVDQVLEHKRRDLRAQGVVVQDRLEHHAAALAQRLGRRVGPRQRRRAVAVGGLVRWRDAGLAQGQHPAALI